MKKFLSLLLSVVLFTSMSGNVLAAEANTVPSQDDIIAQNEINVAKYADSFVDSIYSGAGLEAGDVITILNEDDAISGYCIDIMNGMEPNGYVVVKFSNNEPVISEFCIEDEVTNPYKEIIEESGITGDNLTYYSIGPNEYHVYDSQSDVICGLENELVAVTEFEEYKTQVQEYKTEMASQSVMTVDDTQEDHINYSALDGWSVVSDSYEGTVNSQDTIPGAGSISYYCSSNVDAIDETYACSVVALCNLMKYYRSRGFDEISSSFSTLYSKMWSYAGTSSTGGTTNGDEPGAAKKYLEELGYSCSYKSYLFDTFGDFKSAIGDDKPCLFTYGAVFGDSKGGHAVLAVGYVDTTSYQYLKIADGWNSYLRYINFNGYDYTRTDGWSFTLSE